MTGHAKSVEPPAQAHAVTVACRSPGLMSPADGMDGTVLHQCGVALSKRSNNIGDSSLRMGARLVGIMLDLTLEENCQVEYARFPSFSYVEADVKGFPLHTKLRLDGRLKHVWPS